ncbi:CHAP domain-containing protein [Sphingobium sp. CR2-8]|uniref:CHAP domain-containing protein n=1 Tax=Sphingobium sp. CR2-8 TaxID=1306534 RepID=UPI002DBED94D|nr:CHAP domain-containing protein [Sphingobium sp. CR2-8]MEC3909916.1 CHAP domain-containing protein [Sphingobium sp. CR2-8]
MFRTICWTAALLLSGLAAAPSWGSAVLQCVPYARTVSGVTIRGDAFTWWDQANGQYKRGTKPKKGAVLAFRPNGPMVLGHVAVISKVLDDRRVLIRHANWSVPGAIEEDVLAIDVSDAGDWSQVRVWHSPTGQMGARINPTYGFIYPAKAKLHDFTPDPTLGASVRFAKVDADMWDALAMPRMPSQPSVVQTPYSPVDARAVQVAQARPVPSKSSRRAAPRLEADPFVVEYADATPSQRTLSAIIADVRREAVMN